MISWAEEVAPFVLSFCLLLLDEVLTYSRDEAEHKGIRQGGRR